LQNKVFDRNGEETIEFVRGDMYLAQMKATKVKQRFGLISIMKHVHVAVEANLTPNNQPTGPCVADHVL
jgi:hypothetical protein